MQQTAIDIPALAAQIAAQVRENILAELNPGPWLTLNEAMRYARVDSPKTIHQWRRKGWVYGNKIGGTWRFERKSIDDFFNQEKMNFDSVLKKILY